MEHELDLERARVPSSLRARKGDRTPLGLGLIGEVPKIRTCLAIGTQQIQQVLGIRDGAGESAAQSSGGL